MGRRMLDGPMLASFLVHLSLKGFVLGKKMRASSPSTSGKTINRQAA